MLVYTALLVSNLMWANPSVADVTPIFDTPLVNTESPQARARRRRDTSRRGSGRREMLGMTIDISRAERRGILLIPELVSRKEAF
ncbi:hypothetical protein PN462_21445 [Spirulina sp. CS-785/01]|uniref:hypothetical protein n=1 Tax=Spirulina sp. CS-785/01 TaxID=3021716 RepID=UPI0023312C12|nr:hypothetical protein [Spirulina sp. CS-785/01]MDB9315693.1 hypothetical protein [Spirulina sp. CS-785/01]